GWLVGHPPPWPSPRGRGKYEEGRSPPGSPVVFVWTVPRTSHSRPLAVAGAQATRPDRSLCRLWGLTRNTTVYNGVAHADQATLAVSETHPRGRCHFRPDPYRDWPQWPTDRRTGTGCAGWAWPESHV